MERFKVLGLKFIDIMLIGTILIIIFSMAFSICEPKFISVYKSTEKNRVRDYTKIGMLEEVAVKYYTAIINSKNDDANTMSVLLNKKNDAKFSEIKSKIDIGADVRIKAVKAYEIKKDVYRCSIQILNTEDDAKSSEKLYEITLKLMPTSSLFKVLNENWSI
ncbi:MAG: hypothetical protein RR922_00880 [Clostridia bacterium]